ncbi:MAG: thiosulfate dehydrogenase [quinone] large subunit [Verrucomicrobiales bacterium]|jgi:thiosulfate dehydrogenase [quinone] large subunit
MSEADTSKTTPSEKQPWSGDTMAYLMLRVFIGLRLVMSGLDKFKISNNVIDERGGVSRVRLDELYRFEHLQAKADKIIGAVPKFGGIDSTLAELYLKSLAPLMICVGVSILIGFLNRLSLFAGGMIFISLSFGLMSIGEEETVYRLGVYVALIALAFHYVKANKLALTKW